MRSLPWILAALLFSLLTWVPVEAQGKKQAPARPVLDDAHLFSSKAEEEANAIIAKIKSQSHKDFFVETVETVPLPEDVKTKEAINQFVDHWASERFKTFQIDGVYLLIANNPHKLRVLIGPNTKKEGWFGDENRDHLETILIKHLKSEPDKTLVVAAKYVQDTMAKHAQPAGAVNNPKQAVPPAVVHQQPAHQPQQPAAQGFPTWLIWVGVFLSALLIFWLIMGLARAATGGGAGRGGYGGAPGMGGGGGGGGFMSSMLGGLFGAAAGMYLYNNFFGGHGSSAQAGEPYSGAGGANPQESTDVGAGDPSGGGGDWGGDNAPDAGGGDAGGGGGDWGGGGDAGGGGGDWGGGGGGDWGGGGGGDFGGGGGGGDW